MYPLAITMSRSRYKPPFHRRIIPWVFAIVFVVLAPSLLFYTAGYRLNPNKRVIERNGTLILDTTPGNARIFLNGQEHPDKTAATLQNVTPGTYQVRFERQGYYPWEKRLEVKAEQVTFANKIYLWRQLEPKLLAETTAALLSRAQKKQRFIINENAGSSSTVQSLLVFDNDTLSRRINLPASTTVSAIEWSASDDAIVASTEGDGFWVDIRSTNTQNNLPPVTYRWHNDAVTGLNAERRYSFDPRSKQLSSIVTASGTDELGPASLMNATGTTEQLLSWNNDLNRAFSLPRGQWQIHSIQGDFVLLEDGQRLLAVKNKSSNAQESYGIIQSWLPDAEIPTALIINQNELWLWQIDQNPELLIRNSEAFVRADWHPKAGTIFYATKTQVIALELDNRDGRQRTQLATFENIQNLATVNDRLIILGTKDGKTGVWSLGLE